VPQPVNLNEPAITPAVVNYINSGNFGWTARLDNGAISRKTKAQVKGMLGTRRTGGPKLPEKTEFEIAPEALPASYDARLVFPNCSDILRIRDQSDCGSCWAFGSVEAMSDRNCIFLKKNLSLSTQDVNSCCTSCGDGCNGGYPSAAYTYWLKTGIATDSCDPYTLPPCSHHLPNATNPPPCPANEYPTPKCVRKCNDTETWATAQHYGAKAYAITKGAVAIQQEILANGPVTTAFDVYEDFLSYSGGVYKHTTGPLLGGHAVKILGWGVWNSTTPTPYWIVANSWNTNWGLNGFFYMIRGDNNCGFESDVDAGIPKN